MSTFEVACPGDGHEYMGRNTGPRRFVTKTERLQGCTKATSFPARGEEASRGLGKDSPRKDGQNWDLLMRHASSITRLPKTNQHNFFFFFLLLHALLQTGLKRTLRYFGESWKAWGNRMKDDTAPSVTSCYMSNSR